ncbi:hypothetical protein [Candidatus Lokiarchaeum ossiferum]|uniref:hypothetical protein n=1 Tax=Candidatus Lokiarchaeum ossiferum TaxID=2951803 RepID=UPI00352C3B46
MAIQIYVFLRMSLNGVLFILFILFLYKAIRRKQFAPFLTGSFSLALIGNTIILFTDEIIKINLYGHFLVAVSFSLIYLHCVALINSRPNMFIQIFFISLNSAILLISMLKSFDLLSDNIASQLVMQISSTIKMVALLFSVIIEVKIYSNTKLVTVKIELISIVILLIYAINLFIRDFLFFSEYAMIFTQISWFSVLLGSILLICNYITHANYIYYLPFPIHSIIVYNEGGMLTYAQKFNNSKFTDQLPDALISGIYSAISSLVRDTLGVGAQLQHINADKYQIYFKETSNLKATLAVIALGKSFFFQKSLNKFINSIPNSLINEINQPGVALSDFQQEIEEYVKRSFPYIQILNELD